MADEPFAVPGEDATRMANLVLGNPGSLVPPPTSSFETDCWDSDTDATTTWTDDTDPTTTWTDPALVTTAWGRSAPVGCD